MSSIAVPTSSAATAPGRALEYPTKRLGDEEYGIDIRRVQEIRGFEPAHRRCRDARVHPWRAEPGRGDRSHRRSVRMRFGTEPSFDAVTVGSS
jgi:hypothetical protein